MKVYKWERLNLPLYKDLDDMMIEVYEVLNLDIKVNGEVTQKTKDAVAPAFEYLALIKKKMEIEINMVNG